jgi:hypothetical protein
MSYDLDTLITRWRQEMEDTVEPYLWSNQEIIEYFGEAQDEFCEEVDVLNDEITLTYAASDVWLDVPEYVTRIRDVDAPSNRHVFLYNQEEFDEYIKTDDYGSWIVASDWKSKTGTEPEALITDIKKDQARMYPIPTADGSLTVVVYRRPLEPLEDTEEFEVTDRQHQRCMLLKARSLGYMKQDSETYDDDKANEFEDRFMQQVEKINSRVARSRRRAKSVAYGEL